MNLSRQSWPEWTTPYLRTIPMNVSATLDGIGNLPYTAVADIREMCKNTITKALSHMMNRGEDHRAIDFKDVASQAIGRNRSIIGNAYETH